jgi:large subunit ribosomal protein L15
MSEKKDFLGLHNLVAPIGAKKNPKRLGRGESSGHGKTSGKGNKGQKARKSGNVRIGFEGGQSPLARRLPKRGFTSIHPKDTAINISALADKFEENARITPASLLAAGLIANLKHKVKILSVGEPKKGFFVQVHGISAAAREKIQNSGGQVEILA